MSRARWVLRRDAHQGLAELADGLVVLGTLGNVAKRHAGAGRSGGTVVGRHGERGGRVGRLLALTFNQGRQAFPTLKREPGLAARCGAALTQAVSYPKLKPKIFLSTRVHEDAIQLCPIQREYLGVLMGLANPATLRTLTAKPFGKDGVRLVYASAVPGVTVLEVRSAAAAEQGDATAWHAHGDVLPAADGVVVIKEATATSGLPRTAEWRLRNGEAEATMPISLARPASTLATTAGSSGNGATVLVLDNVELAYNVLQWFGTVAIDLRAMAASRLRESVIIDDAPAAAALPLKDDAVCIGASAAPNEHERALLDAVTHRVRRTVYLLSDGAFAALCAAHPYLCGETGAERRPVLPNLVGGSMLVGHQGHALCIADWAPLVPLGGVVNLAPEHVNPAPAREVVTAATSSGRECMLVEVRCADGGQLTDKPGDGERLLEVLPATLAAMAAAAAHGPVFVHCQQGRSRAGSLATAHLLSTHADWSLYDALSFLAARRPETEIQQSYIEALERFAVGSLCRPPSLATRPPGLKRS